MSKKITIEEVKSRIYKKWGDLIVLVEATYVDTHTKCKFIDKEFGEFERTPIGVFNGCRHSESRKINQKKAAEDFWKNSNKVRVSQNKRKDTNKQKYGVENPFQNKQIQEKQKETVLQKYGVPNVQQNAEVKQKTKKTCAEKYGSDSPLSNPDVRKKIEITCLNRYGASTSLQAPKVKEAREAALVKHCLADGQTLANFAKYNNIPYTSALKVFVAQGEMGLHAFKSSFSVYYSYVEALLKDGLKDVLDLQKCNKKVFLEINKRPDFELIDKKLYLNVDGLYWHSEKNVDKYYHFNLRKEFEKQNSSILQFYEDEIVHKMNIIKSMVVNLLNKSKRIYARQCDIVKVDAYNGKKFCFDNHLMGPGPTHSGFGLVKGGILFSFISIKKHPHGAEIVRFCNKTGHTVVGGFQKLLSHVEDLLKKENIAHIFSFCDLRYASGKSYELAGFKKAGETIGWCWTDGSRRYHRLSCRALKGVSQKEMAKQKRWYKIFDAGQRKYVKTI